MVLLHERDGHSTGLPVLLQHVHDQPLLAALSIVPALVLNIFNDACSEERDSLKHLGPAHRASGGGPLVAGRTDQVALGAAVDRA